MWEGGGGGKEVPGTSALERGVIVRWRGPFMFMWRGEKVVEEARRCITEY
jgi:hypothetical protein